MKTDIIDLEALSQAIRRKREAEGLTLRDVAALLPGGRSISSVQTIETGGRMPDPVTFGAVCQWLGAPVSRFVRGAQESNGCQLPAIRAQIEAATGLDEAGKRFLVEMMEAGYRMAKK